MSTMAPTLAPPPTKSTIQFRLQWGTLVQVPIRLFTPYEDVVPLKRSTYSEAGNPVAQPKVDSKTGAPIASGTSKMMVTVGDKLIELSDDEMADATTDLTVDRTSVPITAFVPLDEIGGRYKVQKSYQARSALMQLSRKSVVDPQADKVFMLLLAVMAKRKVACLFKIGLKGPARFGALCPDGTFHMLHFDNEVRQPVEFPEVKPSKAEIDMGLALLDEVGVGTPDLVDERSERLLAFVAKKAAAEGKVSFVAADMAEAPVAPVLDLTELLAASVKEAKAAKTKAPAKKAAVKKAPAKKATKAA